MLNKEQINELHNVLAFHIMSDSFGRRKHAGKMDGCCFSGSVLFKSQHQTTKTNPSVVQGALPGWQEESRSALRPLLFFR